MWYKPQLPVFKFNLYTPLLFNLTCLLALLGSKATITILYAVIYERFTMGRISLHNLIA